MSTDGGWQMPGPGPVWGAIPYVPQPGVIPLRPLGVGEIIGGVFGTLRRYARAVYLPVLAVTLGAVVLMGVGAGAAVLSLGGLFEDLRDQPDYRPTDGQVAGVTSAIVIGAVLLLCCLVAISTVAYATSTAVIRHAVLGRAVGARQVWAESRPLLWRVLGAQLLAGLAGVGIVVVSLLPALALGLGTGSGAVAAVALLLVIPGWLGALYVEVRLVLVIPALVLEDQPISVAFRRAWRLNEGAWWRSLGIPYLVNMIGSFVTQFVFVPFAVLGAVLLSLSAEGSTTGSAEPTATGAVLMCVLMAVGVVLATALAMPLTPLTHGLLYVDRRIRRESLDAVLAAEAGVPHWAAKPSPYDGTPPSPSTA